MDTFLPQQKHSFTVLVVDDDNELRELLSVELELEGPANVDLDVTHWDLTAGAASTGTTGHYSIVQTPAVDVWKHLKDLFCVFCVEMGTLLYSVIERVCVLVVIGEGVLCAGTGSAIEALFLHEPAAKVVGSHDQQHEEGNNQR